MKYLKAIHFLILFALIISGCNRYTTLPAIPEELNKEIKYDYYFGAINIHLFNENVNLTSELRFDIGEEKPAFIRARNEGIFVIPVSKKDFTPVLTGIFISRPDVDFYIPIHLPLGNRYIHESSGIHCFGQISLYYTPFQPGKNRTIPAIALENIQAEIPPGFETFGRFGLSQHA